MRQLIELEAAREPYEDIRYRSMVKTRRAYGWNRNVHYMVRNFVDQDYYDQSSRGLYEEAQQSAKRTIVHLAARAYELDYGKPPETLADVTEEYIPAEYRKLLLGTELNRSASRQ